MLSGCPSVGMVGPTKHRRGADSPCCTTGRHGRIGDALLQSLVWPLGIVVCDILPEDTEHVGFTQDEQVVEALAAHAAKQALTAGIFLWGAVGSAHLVDACGGGQGGEG